MHDIRQRLPRHGFIVSLAAFGLLAALQAALGLTLVSPRAPVPYATGYDENCYYAFAHTIFFDGDLDFRNQYAYILRTQPQYLAASFTRLMAENSTRPPNVFNAGTGIAALPALAVARAFVAVRGWVSGGEAVSPFAPIYVLAYYWGNLLYGLLAVYLSWRMVRRVHPPAIASAACWAAVLCGPAVFYLLYAPGMSHLTSAFFVAAALTAWMRWRESAGRTALLYAFAAGACAGFAVCVRPYTLPVCLVLAEPLIVAVARRTRVKMAVAATGLAAAGAVLGFLPQMIVWKLLCGTWIANTTGYEFHLLPPHMHQVLFGRRHGLFFWAPALLFAVGGLVAALRSRPHPTACFLLVFLGVAWMAGNWWYYWIGVAFGMRSFVDILPVFAQGFGDAVAGFQRRSAHALRSVWLLIALFAIVNLHLAVAYRSGAVTVDGPLYWLDTVSYGMRYKDQLRRDLQIWTDFGPGRRASLFSVPRPPGPPARSTEK